MTLNFQPMPTASEIVRRTQPGLVHIDTPTGSGSGFVIDAEGLIITNAHVVQEHSTVTAKFVDGAEYTGVVVGRDEEIDLACIRISVSDTHPLSPLPLGDSDAAPVGEDVLAMGYPLADILGGSPTVTRGIISGKQWDEIRTDAAINPGNSGGPLIDPHGFVIGVNTSVIENVGGRNITGIGFAIPCNVVKERIAFLASGGTVAKSVPPKLEDDDGGVEWTTHDVGLCGFSIALPDWWEFYSAKSGFAFFVSGLNSLIVSLNFDGVGFNLYEEADSMRNYKIIESDKWDYSKVNPLEESRLLGERSFSFDYWGDVGDTAGGFVGKMIISHPRSATGGHYLLDADLTVQKGAVEDELELDTVLPLLLSRFIPWDVYWSDRYAWRISAAPGWKPDEDELPDDVSLMLKAADDGLARISLVICDLDDDKSVTDLCQEEVADVLTWFDAWDDYDILSSYGSPTGVNEWHRMTLRYCGKDAPIAVFRIVQVGRSGGLEYVIRSFTLIDYVADYAADMEHMMDSFRF